MTRVEIRKLVRGLIFEFTEAPEGLLQDDASGSELDLNSLINLSLEKVELDLIPYIPREFRKPKLISITANKREYTVKSGGDINISDFLAFENIFHNETGQKPQGLLFVHPDQIYRYANVGEKGDPRVWSYEERNEIAFDPTPSATIADRYKSFYFYKIPDLTDDAHIPELPAPAHLLVAIDAARQCHLIDEESMTELDKRYATRFNSITRTISIEPSISDRFREKLTRQIR